MSKLRISYAGAIHHIYNQGVNKRDIFLDFEDKDYLIWLFSTLRQKYSMNIFSFIIMPNHFHMLLQSVNNNLSEGMWHLGKRYAEYFNVKYDRVGPLFRSRFKTQLVENIEYFRAVLRYIHNNPIESGFIKDIFQSKPVYRSSFFDLMGLTSQYNWLAKNELYDLLGINPMVISMDEIETVLWNKIDKKQFKDYTRKENVYIEVHPESRNWAA